MTLREVRRILDVLRMAPEKSLGQNFLVDRNLARVVVDALQIGPEDQVIEIGPGLGALTTYLESCARRLTLIEKDARLVGYLRRRFSGSHIEVVHADAVEFNPLRLLGHGRMKVIGNLPYYASTPILEKFTDALLPVDRIIFTLQRELAQRLNASPRTKNYGAMTICLGRRWRVEYLRTLPACVFYPEPKVDSAVIALEPRPASETLSCDEALFENLVRTGFSERRKQLRKLLPHFNSRWPELVSALAISQTVRAEELSIRHWEELTRLVSPHSAQALEELFPIVDENDNVIGAKPRREVHAENLRHRAIHVLLFNAENEVLLQKRSIWKDKNPGKWDSSVAGHVDAGESYRQAAEREMMEEIGCTAEIEPIAKLGCGPETGYEFLQVYRGHHQGPFRFASLEVAGGAFFSVAQVRDWLAARPADFTPVFRLAFPLVAEAG